MEAALDKYGKFESNVILYGSITSKTGYCSYTKNWK